MEKFCSHCGKDIEEGQCTCDTEKNSQKKEYSMGVGKVDFDKVKKEGFHLLKDMKTLAIRMIKEPMSTFLEEIKTPQIKMASALILTYGLIVAFIAIQSIYKINQMSRGLVWEATSVGFSTYLKAFITPIMAVAFQVFLITSLVIGLGMIFKSTPKKEKIFTMVGLTYMPAIICSLLGMIVSIIFPSLGMLVGTVGLMMMFLLLYVGVKELLELDENKAIYFVPLIVVIFIFISGFLLKTSLVSNLSGMMNFFF